jgi:hypothetical protein
MQHLHTMTHDPLLPMTKSDHPDRYLWRNYTLVDIGEPSLKA